MRVLKPFWSFNIKNTEKWLSEKAFQGYILKDVDTIFKIFNFEKEESKRLSYRVCYENKGAKEISNPLKRDGWYNVCNKGRWFFIANEKEEEEIKINPSREKLLKRIRITNGVLSLIAAYFGLITTIYLIFLGPMIARWASGSKNIKFFNVLSNKVQVTRISYFTTKDILDSAIMLVILGTLIYLRHKLNKRENELKQYFSYDVLKEEEKLEIKENLNIINRRKTDWFYEPDKLENWLEDMEASGLNLYEVNKSGKEFYFIEGKPRKARYIVDYQFMANESCDEIYKQDGWKDIFSTMGTITRWTIWCKEYIDERPNIYTDRNDVINNAKKILITYSILLAVFITIFTPIIFKQIKLFINYGWEALMIFTFIPDLLLIYYCYYYSKVVRFYNRVK